MIPHYYTLTTRSMVILACDTPTLALGKKTLMLCQLEGLVDTHGFILWDNQGRWGIVSQSHVTEWLRSIELFKRQKKQYPRMVAKTPTINFESTIPVSDRVAKVLRSQNTPQELDKTSPSPGSTAGS